METLVVELMGLPHCGRTTLMRGLHRELALAKWRVQCFPEEAQRSPLPQWQTEVFDFFTRTVNETTSNIIDAKELGGSDVVLVERGILDHIVSAKALQAAGLISEDKARRIIRYLEPHKEKENLVIYLKISARESRQRDEAGDPTMPCGLVTNPAFLEQLQTAYREAMPTIPENKLLKIDGTKEIPKVREIALRAIYQKLQEGGISLNPKVTEGTLTFTPKQSLNQKGGKKEGVTKGLLGSLGNNRKKLGWQVRGRDEYESLQLHAGQEPREG